MESTTTDHQFFDADASLSEPHFDDEATVLSARPVVPLATVNGVKGTKAVKAKRSFPRPWILGLALVAALMVGVLATTIYYSRSIGNDSKLFDDTQIATGVDANTTKSADSFSGTVAALPAVKADIPVATRRQSPAVNQPLKSSAALSRKPVARLVGVIREKRSSSQAIVGRREDRRAARKQARQVGRRAEREKREGSSSSDLLRIRDIFEGSPRP